MARTPPPKKGKNRCPTCGMPLPKGVTSCPKCGKKPPAKGERTPPKRNGGY